MQWRLEQTDGFKEWLQSVKDKTARARIAARIDRLKYGHFGDAKDVGDKVHELRLHFGPGYRAYYVLRDKALVLLLCGGTKATQNRDIAEAKRLAKEGNG